MNIVRFSFYLGRRMVTFFSFLAVIEMSIPRVQAQVRICFVIVYDNNVFV